MLKTSTRDELFITHIAGLVHENELGPCRKEDTVGTDAARTPHGTIGMDAARDGPCTDAAGTPHGTIKMDAARSGRSPHGQEGRRAVSTDAARYGRDGRTDAARSAPAMIRT